MLTMDTSTILIISDLQSPAHHPDTIPFLREVKKQFKPTLVIGIGDLEDFHRLNFHGVNPNLPSAHVELLHIRAFVKNLTRLFPDMLEVDSNHGALPKRKAHAAGIPDAMMKSPLEIIEAPKGWKRVKKIVLRLPNGLTCLFKHKLSGNLLNDSFKKGMSVVCGHFHTKAFVQYYQNDFGINFAMQVGSLVNREHDALEYGEDNSLYPVLTVGIIKGGIPMLIPMYVNKKNRWLGYI